MTQTSQPNPPPADGIPALLDYKKKLAKVDLSQHSAFWRACRFLKPHAGLMVFSVICALFVGAAVAGSVSAMLPIVNVLSNKGDSVQSWANRQVVERRIGVRVGENPDRLDILRIDKSDVAQQAGMKTGYLLPEGQQGVRETLEKLAEPTLTEADVQLQDGKEVRTVHLPLRPVSTHMQIFRGAAYRLPGADHPILTLGAVFCVLASIAFVGNLARFFQEYVSDKVSILTVNDLRRRLYDHILHVPMEHFTLNGSSDLTSRLAGDTAALQEGFKALLGPSIQEPIKVAFVMGVVLYLDPWMTLFVVAFAPLMAAMIRRFGKKMRRASRQALESSASMIGQIEATLSGIRVVKGSNAEPFERRRYTRIMDELIKQAMKMSRIDAASAPIIESLTILLVGAVLMFAGYRIFVTNQLTSQSFIVMMGSLAFIGESLRRISKINNLLQRSNAAATRVFEVIDLPVERPRYLSTDKHEVVRPREKLPPLRNSVTFEKVTFTYPGATSPAIVEADLTVKAGQSVAVVGRNGSGKTTLLALLPRFYNPDAGRILIDGVDVRDVTLKSLREQISIVTQDSVIFPGTFLDNIAYGVVARDSEGNLVPSVRDQAVAAAKKAHAHEFVMAKPQGYETMLHEMGGGLSGGQKQRICIARAIFRASPILILDEATSQVDAESEELIQQAIEEVMHGRTTFVIAHRWATIRSADAIIVLDKGKIVGQGTHEDLMQRCDAYQQLYERQMQGVA